MSKGGVYVKQATALIIALSLYHAVIDRGR